MAMKAGVNRNHMERAIADLMGYTISVGPCIW